MFPKSMSNCDLSIMIFAIIKQPYGTQNILRSVYYILYIWWFPQSSIVNVGFFDKTTFKDDTLDSFVTNKLFNLLFKADCHSIYQFTASYIAITVGLNYFSSPLSGLCDAFTVQLKCPPLTVCLRDSDSSERTAPSHVRPIQSRLPAEKYRANKINKELQMNLNKLKMIMGENSLAFNK